MQCAGESEVAPISQWGDDETPCVTKVLVAIGKLSIDSTDEQLILPVIPAVEVGQGITNMICSVLHLHMY